MEWIAGIEESNKIIGQWIQEYYYDWEYLLVIAIAFVYLFIVCKGLRYRWLLPIVAILFIVVNPILYQYVFSKIVYWRLFWMLPSSLLIATAIVVFIKRQRLVWKKWLLLLATSGLIVTQGYSVFGYGNFESVQNWEKISQETIEVCDVMLEIDENPRAIVSQNLFSEIRQYAPKIELMYGRNAYGYIREIEGNALDIHHHMLADERDYAYILSRAIDCKYNFVVVEKDKEIQGEKLSNYEYKECGRSENYIVYYNGDVKFEQEKE